MENTDTQLTATWPKPARDAFEQCRNWFHTIADEAGAGPLDESPKWGQPSWRPRKPRTGSTLRLSWSPKSPDTLTAYVDCKSTLAATMADLYPTLPNDGNRAIALDLRQPLPKDALCHLAALTFTYHRKPRS
jgi:hypothetical protein